MPSTENATLQRIQREISEVMEREKELKTLQCNGDATNGGDSTPKEVRKPPLQHSKSVPNPSPNGRRFAQNPAAKGMMQKFIKSRGKITAATALTVPSQKEEKSNFPVLDIPDFVPPKPSADPSQYTRKGYVPVREKLKKELEDLHAREIELRTERRKSQPDFSFMVEIDPPPALGEATIKRTRSMAQLYDEEEYVNFVPSNLKAAKSLAELCDASEDELETPGSHSLICRFEEMIQQARS